VVGHDRAIEVDRVAPGFGDGGIETAELVFQRGSVLGLPTIAVRTVLAVEAVYGHRSGLPICSSAT
jgi:hypothetical protein